MNAPISREIALRLGLAARALPDTDVARLLRVLDDAVGLPPTREKLDQLTLDSLSTAAEGEFAEIDKAFREAALAALKGTAGWDTEPLPETQTYADGDMPGSVRIACASNSGEQLDGHFGSCERFLVYQVSSSEARLVDVRPVEAGGAEDDKNTYRASLIGDCQVLFVMSIGGPAAAKVVKSGIHPVKLPAGGSARAQVEALMPRLAGSAPPWLSKVMGKAPEDRVLFELAGES